MSEKEIGNVDMGVAESQASHSHKEVLSDAETDMVDWTREEETRLVRKLDWIILTPLVLAFFALQLDRGNIGAAYTDLLTFDIGITQDQYNNGNTLMSVGIVILEIPSNMILYKLGPRLWLGGQVFAWGLVATFQAWMKSLGPFYATRFLLGLCESGFIPGALYTLSRWYKKDEISKRFAIYFFGNNLATALSGLLSAGILRMEGLHGLKGWQWIFILEGAYTILCAILFLIVFPKSPGQPISLTGIRWFNERDAHVLQSRVLVDDPLKGSGRQHVSWHELKRTLTNWRLFPHMIIPLCGLAPAWTFGAYAPYLVMQMGFNKIKANALCSAGGFMLLPINLLYGYISDKTHRRGIIVSVGLAIYLAFAIANREVIHVNDTTMRLPMLLLLVAFSAGWHPINCSWVALNTKTPEERTISMAIVTMCANLAGLIGTQLFQASDAPWFPHGWSAIAGVVGTAFAMSLIANAQYYLLNRRLRNTEGAKLYYK